MPEKKYLPRVAPTCRKLLIEKLTNVIQLVVIMIQEIEISAIRQKMHFMTASFFKSSDSSKKFSDNSNRSASKGIDC